MTKTITANMTTHLALESTTLATLVRLTRTDGTVFRFTDHDASLTFDGDLYEASYGYDMSNITNKSGLSVDELEVNGFLDSSALTEADLRAGLFDYAQVEMSLVNYESLADGEVLLRRGRLGEVSFNDVGLFQAELRGLTQAYSQNVIRLIESECDADVGDSRCKVGILPDVLARNTAYAADDLVRTASDLEGIIVPTILSPFDTDGDDISPNAFTGTLTNCSISSAQSKFGGSSLHFTAAGGGRCAYADDPAFAIGTNEFTIEAQMFVDNFGGGFRALGSQYNNGGNQRAWWAGISATNFNLFLSVDGGSSSPSVGCNPKFAGGFSLSTWYHLAMTRDSGGVIRMYVDGTQINGTRGLTLSVAAANTFSRPSGSWIDDGFAANQKVTIAGFSNANNNGTFTVSSVTASNLVITTSPLTTETGDGDEAAEVVIDISVFDGSEDITVGYVNSTTDILMSGYIDEFRLVNGYAAWTGTSFTPPSVAYTAGITQALLDSLVTVDFDDVTYRCTTAGTTGPAQPAYDTTPGNTTSDGTAVFTTEEAFTRAIVVGTVTNDRIFTVTFPNGADPREVDDWFKYGAVKWETGLNAGLTMDVKGMVATTDEVTLFLTMPFSVQVGDTGYIYAGCDRTLATCKAKFDNVVNYRGFPYLPGQDEYLSTPKLRR